MLMRLHLSCCTQHILQSDVVVIFSTLVNHVAQHPWEQPAYLYIHIHLNLCVCEECENQKQVLLLDIKKNPLTMH